MGVRENKVERYLDAQVNAIGGITRKWVCPGVNGVPDRIVIHFGKVWFVEVKTVDGVLSPAQTREQVRLRLAGVKVKTVYGETDVDNLIELIKKESQ